LQRATILGGNKPLLGECRISLDDSDIRFITRRLRLTGVKLLHDIVITIRL